MLAGLAHLAGYNIDLLGSPVAMQSLVDKSTE